MKKSVSAFGKGLKLGIEIDLDNVDVDGSGDHDPGKGNKIDENLGVVACLQVRPDIGRNSLGIGDNCCAKTFKQQFTIAEFQNIRVEPVPDQRTAKEGDGDIRLQRLGNRMREDPDLAIADGGVELSPEREPFGIDAVRFRRMQQCPLILVMLPRTRTSSSCATRISSEAVS